MAADPLTSNTVDGLLNYDLSDGDDPFADKPLNKSRDDKSTFSPRPVKRKAEIDEDGEIFNLGVDQEAKVTKARRKIAKLDEARLLSQPGLPKLKTLAQSGHFKRKLRLKGKGHEFTDAARLLMYYQLWLDDLYPRAKFADALQLVEKAGHSKSMQRTRKEWIDEGKPGYLRDHERRKEEAAAAAKADVLMSGALEAGDKEETATGSDQHRPSPKSGNSSRKLASGQQVGDDDDDLFFADTNGEIPDQPDSDPEEDELDALMAEQGQTAAQPNRPLEPESEGEDDLDALLAEQEASRRPRATASMVKETTIRHDNDGLDALLEEQEARPSNPVTMTGSPTNLSRPTSSSAAKEPTKAAPDASKHSAEASDNDLEDDELDALLAQQPAHQQPTTNLITTDYSTLHQDTEDPVDLPPTIPKSNTPPPVGNNTGKDSQTKDSEILFSSSPLPNDDLDDQIFDTVLPPPQSTHDNHGHTHTSTPATSPRIHTDPNTTADHQPPTLLSSKAQHQHPHDTGMENEEPDLPSLQSLDPAIPSPQRQQQISKDSQEGVENGTIIFSSSPLPNSEMNLDELDALMDAQG